MRSPTINGFCMCDVSCAIERNAPPGYSFVVFVSKYSIGGRREAISSNLVAGQSHLIFGTGSTSCIITGQLSKPYCINALYKTLENLDAIALNLVVVRLDTMR